MTLFLLTGSCHTVWQHLAPEAVLAKSAVLPEMLQHEGPARVFESEEEACEASLVAKFNPATWSSSAEGPKGGPGMRKC